MDRASSLRPAPSRPVIPRISPFHILKLTWEKWLLRLRWRSSRSGGRVVSADDSNRARATGLPVMCASSCAVVSSLAGNTPTGRPSRSTVTFSEIARTSSSLWLTKSVEMSFERSSSMTRTSASTSGLVSAVVGSSMMMSFAPCVRARAMATSCRLETGRSSTTASRSMSAWTLRSSHSASLRMLAHPMKFRPFSTIWLRAMFSATVRLGNSEKILVDDLDPGADRGDGGGGPLAATSAVEHNLAAVRLGDPGDDLDEGRLARAVLPHQRVDLAPMDGDAGVAERLDALERLGDALDVQEDP